MRDHSCVASYSHSCLALRPTPSPCHSRHFLAPSPPPSAASPPPPLPSPSFLSSEPVALASASHPLLARVSDPSPLLLRPPLPPPAPLPFNPSFSTLPRTPSPQCTAPPCLPRPDPSGSAEVAIVVLAIPLASRHPPFYLAVVPVLEICLAARARNHLATSPMS